AASCRSSTADGRRAARVESPPVPHARGIPDGRPPHAPAPRAPPSPLRDRIPMSHPRVVARDAAMRTPRAFPALPAALAASPGACVLDVRDADAFGRGHVAGSGRLSLAEFTSRRAELPARDVAVVVADDVPERARAAANALAALGYERVAWLERSLGE